MSHDPFYPETAEQIQEIAKARKFIPDDVFPTVRQWSNTPTADLVPTRYGPRGFECLLAKRREAPWAGEWFFSGGRILPLEVPATALQRICRRELGFVPKVGDTKHLLWQSIYNPECEHGGVGYFTLSSCYQVWVEFGQEIKLDFTQSEYQWFTADELKEMVLPVYVQEAIAHLHRDPVRSLAMP